MTSKEAMHAMEDLLQAMNIDKPAGKTAKVAARKAKWRQQCKKNEGAGECSADYTTSTTSLISTK